MNFRSDNKCSHGEVPSGNMVAAHTPLGRGHSSPENAESIVIVRVFACEFHAAARLCVSNFCHKFIIKASLHLTAKCVAIVHQCSAKSVLFTSPRMAGENLVG